VHSIVDLPGKKRGTAIERMHEKSIGAVYNKAFKSCFSKRLRYKDVQMQEFILWYYQTILLRAYNTVRYNQLSSYATTGPTELELTDGA